MRKVILKGPYRIKKVKNKLSGLETKLKEKIGYREVKIDDCKVIAEGKIIEQYKKEPQKKKEKV